MIDRLFKVTEINKAGIYCVSLFVDGVATDVVVDDHLPCHEDSDLPIFASSLTEGEIWPCLLEKAWAKLHHSYCMVRLGSPTIALAALTEGRPFEVLSHNGVKVSDLQRKLEKFLKKSHRLLACPWDNQYEEHVSGRIVNPSAPVFTIYDVDSDSLKLKSHSDKEIDEEISFDDFIRKYRLTIKQKINFKQQHVMSIVEDFSDSKADQSDVEGLIAE